MFAAVDAVGNPGAAVGIARERESVATADCGFDALDSGKVSDVVLRHRCRPSSQFRTKRFGSNIQ